MDSVSPLLSDSVSNEDFKKRISELNGVDRGEVTRQDKPENEDSGNQQSLSVLFQKKLEKKELI